MIRTKKHLLTKKKLMESQGERARDRTTLSTPKEENSRGSSPSREKALQNEINVRKKVEIAYHLQKKEMKLLEVKYFKLSNKCKGISTKLQESEGRVQDLEGQVKNLERTVAEKTNALMLQTAKRRDLSEKLTAMKIFKDRALNAEKQVSELTEDNKKLEAQLDMSQQKTVTLRNESEAYKVDLKKQTDLLRTRENTISNLKIGLVAKQKQIDGLKDEIKRQRRVAEVTELEVNRNRQNEEVTIKRIKYKDEENLSLRKEVTALHKDVSDFERKLSKQDLQYQILQEKYEHVNSDQKLLQTQNQTLEETIVILEKEVVTTQTFLQKFQQENKFLTIQVEHLKAKLADEMRSSKESKIKFEKDLRQKHEEYTKLEMQTEETLSKSRRASEAIYCHDRKIGIQADLIREQERKIMDLSKEVLRLHENEQKFKMVKETYSKVERLWMDEEKGDIIFLPDDDTKNEKLKMYRFENHKLSTKLKEKEEEIKDLKLEEEKLQEVMKNLKCKLDLLPQDALDRVQESQSKFKALKKQIQAQQTEISVYVTKIKTQESNITELKNKLSNISFSMKDKLLPVQSRNIKLKSEDTDPKPMKKHQNIVYLPPLQVISCGKAK
ncbi:trichohyalin-like [Poecilia reticulata]|uniref:trichohyalin-like n=1 Tax=Poecilia reticulata TaxID=8081 RepID=UPI0004A363B2|nr:PREDICTED: trichohyalin-like [Poecilia reticulata]